MIDYLIEIVFKNAPIERIDSLIKELTSTGKNIVEYNVTCNPEQINWESDHSVKDLFTKNKDFGTFALFINLSELKLNNYSISRCGIAIYNYTNSIDLELDFQLSDVKGDKIDRLAETLMEFATSIATRFEIQEYYCGIEPAKDLATRLFTKNKLGPLFLKT